MSDYNEAFGADDWADTPDKVGFEPLEPGWYRMVVYLAELKTPSKGGSMAVITLEVAPGHNGEGRKVTDYQCIHLPHSPKGQEIGRAAHKAMCKALGFTDRPSSLRDLEGRALDVKLKIETDPSGQYDPSNRVVAFRSPESAAPKVNAYAAALTAGGGDPTDLPFGPVEAIR